MLSFMSISTLSIIHLYLTIYLAVIGRLSPGIGLGWFISGALEEGSDGLGVLLGDPLDILPISYKKQRYLLKKIFEK